MAEPEVTIEGLVKKDADKQQDTVGNLIKGEFKQTRSILSRIEKALSGSSKAIKEASKASKKSPLIVVPAVAPKTAAKGPKIHQAIKSDISPMQRAKSINTPVEAIKSPSSAGPQRDASGRFVSSQPKSQAAQEKRKQEKQDQSLAAKIGGVIKKPFAKGLSLFTGREGGGESEASDAAGTAAGGPLYSAMKEVYDKKDDPIVEKLTGLFRKKEDGDDSPVKEAVEFSRDEDEKRAKREERLERRRARRQLKATKRANNGKGGILGGLGRKLKILGPIFKGLKVFGKILGKLAIPITLAIATFDAFNGFFNASAITGISEDMLTTTDRVKAALASAVEGLTFGLVSAESWFDGTMASYADKVKLAIDNTIKKFTDKLAGVEKWVNDSIKSVVDLAKSALGKAIETLTLGYVKADDVFKKEESSKSKQQPEGKPKQKPKSALEKSAAGFHPPTQAKKTSAGPAYNLNNAKNSYFNDQAKVTHDPTARQKHVAEKSKQVKLAKGKLDQKEKSRAAIDQQAVQRLIVQLNKGSDASNRKMLEELKKIAKELKREGDVPQKISNETLNAIIREQERLAS
jgi:hypothetical protein